MPSLWGRRQNLWVDSVRFFGSAVGFSEACEGKKNGGRGGKEGGPRGCEPTGPAVILPASLGYLSLGCSPAEPNSVSPSTVDSNR